MQSKAVKFSLFFAMAGVSRAAQKAKKSKVKMMFLTQKQFLKVQEVSMAVQIRLLERNDGSDKLFTECMSGFATAILVN
ncbi:hypothetical protein [Acetonema longum]|uniref:Uncharacterized protein n=1 Tax=Acetonema longum DSM 6540 TaxID=1009370 RepID=F7NNN7_9FIRM|nr:hypothetical protein [Acetonema longum]EGO62339.1 hypothetical protein ALO_18642 [Acetonema longum DSM 6540]